MPLEECRCALRLRVPALRKILAGRRLIWHNVKLPATDKLPFDEVRHHTNGGNENIIVGFEREHSDARLEGAPCQRRDDDRDRSDIFLNVKEIDIPVTL